MGNEFGFSNNNEVVVHELSQIGQQVLLDLFSLPSNYEANKPSQCHPIDPPHKIEMISMRDTSPLTTALDTYVTQTLHEFTKLS